MRVSLPASYLKTWRRGWDLNPRYPLRYVRFRGGSFQPLTHLSASANLVVSGGPWRKQRAQDFGSGLPLRSRPLSASTFEADRFNRSRTSPEGSCQWPVASCQLNPDSSLRSE